MILLALFILIGPAISTVVAVSEARERGVSAVKVGLLVFCLWPLGAMLWDETKNGKNPNL